MHRRYQLGRHWQGTRLSAALIASFLDPDAKTAIDIGANEGALSCVLAKCGLDVLAVEQNRGYLDRGGVLARQMGVSPTFEARLHTLEDLHEMAPVDVSLLLSVHHQLTAQHGLEHANEYLRALAAKTRSQMFFQPAAILRKYKREMPFGDNDVLAITRYFMDLLEGVFPYRTLIGYSPNDVPRREPLRPMILFSHAPADVREGRDVIDILNDLKLARRATHPLLRIASK